ncbi:putative metallohydrolase yodQ [Fusarium bulbicola]|nr:putative metallohydrolase yodQ [Fusarium bulbicola]
MSLAAHDLFNRTDRDQQHRRQQFYSSMLQHKLRSIQDMRHLLSTGKGLDDTHDPISQCEKDGFLITVMLHSLMEIATNSTSEWAVQTLGGLSMVKRYGHEPFSPEVYRFVTDHFSLSEAFLATTGTELEIEDLNGWLVSQRKSMFPILRSTHGRSRINPYTGLSSELIQNITWITSTIQRHSGPGSDRKSAAVMRTELQVVENRLGELEQWSEDSDMESLIYLNAAAFEAAAWVYLRVAQYGSDAEEIQKELLPKLFQAIRRVHERQDALIGLSGPRAGENSGVGLCKILMEWRTMPADVAKAVPGLKAEFRIVMSRPSMATASNHPFVELITDVVGDVLGSKATLAEAGIVLLVLSLKRAQASEQFSSVKFAFTLTTYSVFAPWS